MSACKFGCELDGPSIEERRKHYCDLSVRTLLRELSISRSEECDKYSFYERTVMKGISVGM